MSVVDREQPHTPAEAARAMWENDREIARVTADLRALRDQMPALLKARRMTYARAFLTAEGPEYFRKQKAEQAVVEATFAVDTCDQKMEACRDRLRDLRGVAEDLRAINSNLKEELRTLGSMP